MPKRPRIRSARAGQRPAPRHHQGEGPTAKSGRDGALARARDTVKCCQNPGQVKSEPRSDRIRTGGQMNRNPHGCLVAPDCDQVTAFDLALDGIPLGFEERLHGGIETGFTHGTGLCHEGHDPGKRQSVSVSHENALALCRSRQPAFLRSRAPTGATGRRLREGAAEAAGRGRGLSRVRQSRTRFSLGREITRGSMGPSLSRGPLVPRGPRRKGPAPRGQTRGCPIVSASPGRPIRRPGLVRRWSRSSGRRSVSSSWCGTRRWSWGSIRRCPSRR